MCVSVHHSLDMDVVSGCHDDHIGDKVVLHSGVDLDDVTPLTPHVEVVNGGILQILWSLANGKSMRPATRTSVSLLYTTDSKGVDLHVQCTRTCTCTCSLIFTCPPILTPIYG